MGQASGKCLDCAKNMDKNWNTTVSFIIHVNFDHAWAEHYPITLTTQEVRVYFELRYHDDAHAHCMATYARSLFRICEIRIIAFFGTVVNIHV